MLNTVLHPRKIEPKILSIPFLSDPWNFAIVSNTLKFSGYIFLKLYIWSYRCILMRYVTNSLHISKVPLIDLPRQKRIFNKTARIVWRARKKLFSKLRLLTFTWPINNVSTILMTSRFTCTSFLIPSQMPIYRLHLQLHIYTRNHHFLTGSTRSVVSWLSTSNTIDVLKSHPI